MKIIFTKKGEQILVDDSDFNILKKWKWSVNSNGYAVRFTEIKGIKKGIKMHRQILELEDYSIGDVETDHINRNKLDNRRENLRIVERNVNQRNRNPYQYFNRYDRLVVVG